MSTKRKWLDIDEIESGTGTARETGPAARRMAGGRAGGWISIDALESRGEQQGAALLRLAGEVAARQKQEAAREAQSSPMERLASEMAADRQERARRTASAPQRASGYLTGGGQSAVRPSYGLPAGTVSAPMQAKQQARQMRETALAAQLSQAPKYPRGMTEMNDTAAEYQANHAPALSRIAAGAKSIGHSLAGSVPALAELAGQYDANRRADLANPERQTLLKENEMLSNRLTAIRQGYGNAAWGSEADIRAQMDANTRRLRGELRASDTASPDGFGMRQMRRSAEQQEQALAGMTGAPRFLAGNGLSIANNAPALAAGAVLGPAASMALMGAQAAASKGYELNERGLSPEESLVRGLASGGIEALTEKYSIEGLWDIAKGTGAKTAVRNLLRQAGVEASEESASYALNYLTDKLARDPEATFSLAELAESAAGGALSGGVYGGVGLAVNRLLYAPQTAQQAQDTAQAAPQAQGAAQAVQAVPQTQDAAQRVQNPVQQVQVKAQQAQNQVQQVQNQVQAAPVRRAYAVQKLGENGLKNYQFLKKRDGGKTPDFDEQHAHYYNAARSGMAVDKIPAYPSATPLDGTARQAAAFAGQNDGLSEAAETVQKLMDGKVVSDMALDRALSFPETRKALAEQAGALPEASSQARKAVRDWAAARKQEQAAQVVNQPGLVRDIFSAGLDAKTAERVDRIAKRAGVSVAFSDRLGDAAGTYQDGRITLRAGAENPEMGVLVHELTHHLETSGEYQALSDLVARHVEQDMGVDFGTLVQQQMDEYAQFGDTLTEDGARRELIAKFAQDYLFTDERSIQRLAQENRSLVQKIRDWLHDFVSRFTGDKETREEARFLRNAEKLYIRALESAEGRQTGETQHDFMGYDEETGRGWYRSNFPEGTPKSHKSEKILSLIQNVWSKEPIPLQITENGRTRTIMAQFDPTVPNEPHVTSDATKLAGGNKRGNGSERRVAMNLADDYPRIIRDSRYDSSKSETGKKIDSHKDVRIWHYFVNDILYSETENDVPMPYQAVINIKEKDDGGFVYSFAVRQQFEINKKEALAPGGMRTDVRADGNDSPNARTSDNSIAQPVPDGKTENLDGQKSQGASFKELERRAEVIDYLRGQMQRTKGLKADPKRVKELAGELLNEYSSGYEKAELSDVLQQLYDTYANRTDADAFGEMQQAARTLARDVLEQSAVLNEDTAADYWQLRDYLKKTPLTISDVDKADVPGGFGEFRKAHMGRLRLTQDGLSVDTAYMELNADFGEALFPADITHPADQLAQIADVLDSLEPVYENPYSRDMSGAASAMADDMMSRLFKLPQAKPTFADRQAAKLDAARAGEREARRQLRELAAQYDRDTAALGRAAERAGQTADRQAAKLARAETLIEENRERAKQQLAEERRTREQKLADLKARQRQKDANRRDKMGRAELRRKITRHAGSLSKKLLNPTDTQHIPESLRTTVAALLDSINLEAAAQIDPVTGKRSKYQTDPVTGKYMTRPVLDENGNPVLIEKGRYKGQPRMEYVPLESGDPTKRTEAFRKLREEYGRILDQDEEMVIDPDLDDNLMEVEALSALRLEEMSADNLETTWKVLKAVETSISNAGKLLHAGRFKTVKALGAAFETEGKRRTKDRIRFSGVMDKIDSTLNIEMMAPYDYFHALGKGGEAVYKSLRQALDQKVRDHKVVRRFSEKLLEGTDIKKWSGRQAKTTVFHTSGGDLTMTPAQVMSLYKLMQREQAVEHILKGGIRPTTIQKGSVELAAGAPVKVTLDDVSKIVSTLTDEQKRIADGFGSFMSGTLSEWGNETSMALYGYKKFREENYFPIQSDKNYTKVELGEDGLDTRVKQKGWTKATVKGANNAIMIEDIFDVFTRHADEMGTYHSFLPTLEDMSRVFNFKYMDDTGETHGSVKQTIDHLLGKHGQDYFRKLFNDLNGGIRAEGGSWRLANFKAAAVGGNLRVVVQQPTAFFRAYAVMDAKYLTGGLLHKSDFQEMVEHSPIAQWKDWGYYQLDLGRTTKEILLGQEGFGRRLTEFFMKPAGAMDNLTWTRLWNACKLEIEDTTDFQKGSRKYWKAVSERFDEVIDRTQVVDSVLHRSHMMRSTDGLTRMYTSFMAEPTKTYNLTRSTGVDLIQRKPGAGKAFARAAVAVLVNSAATAAAAAILDAARGGGDDEEEKGFWGRYREAAVENFADQINPAGWNPYLKDFLSLFQGYEVKRTDMTPIADVVKAFSVLRRAQTGEGKVTTEAAMAELLFKLSKVFGLPVANLKRDVTAAVNTVLDGLQANGVNTYGVRFRWDMFKTAQNEDTASWWMEQGFAARDAGDSETAERIFQMLHDKQLKTRKEIRDYERNVHGKEKNELVKLAYEAQLDGDDEGFQLYSDALREMGMDDSDIEKALGGKAEQAATDEFGFRDYRSDVEIRIQDEAYESRTYETLGAKQRERFEKDVRDYSNKMTKDAKFEDFEIEDQWMFACRDAKQKCGLSESQFIMARAAANCVESIKDKDGETIANSKGLRKMQAIYEIPGLNDKQRAYLFEACNVGKSIRHYNKAKVQQDLDKMEKRAAK